MPSLQDMLGDFDMSRLEELAESLLADVTTNMEENTSESIQRITEDESIAERMLEQLVGTTTKQLESTKNKNINLNSTKRHFNENAPCSPLMVDLDEAESETLYGTYDEKTNSITIVLPEEEDEPISTWNEPNTPDFLKYELLSPIQSSKSPIPSCFSDGGYESIGSPCSEIKNYDELWNSSFSELFPSLV